MNARTRKLAGGVLLLAFILLYVGVMLAIADQLPDSPWVKLAFFLVAGTAWGLPILPLLTWMNRGR